MGRSRAALTGALIGAVISGALIDLARGGDRVECEPQRVTGDGHYWAYRIIDDRECWYPGRPGKPKNELYWGRATTLSARQTVDQPEPETEAVPSEPPSRLVAAPPEKPQIAEAMPAEWRATAADQLLAFTCCWPELEEPAWPLALLPLGLYPLWWIAKQRRGSRAVRAGDVSAIGVVRERRSARRVTTKQLSPSAQAVTVPPSKPSTNASPPPTKNPRSSSSPSCEK